MIMAKSRKRIQEPFTYMENSTVLNTFWMRSFRYGQITITIKGCVISLLKADIQRPNF